MNARDLVSLLLEADQGSVNDRTGVYIVGPKLPNEGYVVPSMEEAIKEFERLGIIRQGVTNVEGVMDYLVNAGYTFFLKKAPGDIEVIGRVPAETTSEGQKRAAQYLGLDRQQQVQHRAAMTATPKGMSVDAVLFGSKELERQQREREKPAQREKPAAGKGRWDFTTLSAPLEIGFVYSDTEQGLRIMEVIPGGPAAQAGLLAGDLIVQVREFKARDSDELVGPYYVYNAKHLQYVLRKADPNYLIPFRVYRGDQPINVPIKPEPKKQEAQAAPAEPVRPTQQLTRPNERTPASQTGNQPANVSSIT